MYVPHGSVPRHYTLLFLRELHFVLHSSIPPCSGSGYGRRSSDWTFNPRYGLMEVCLLRLVDFLSRLERPYHESRYCPCCLTQLHHIPSRPYLSQSQHPTVYLLSQTRYLTRLPTLSNYGTLSSVGSGIRRAEVQQGLFVFFLLPDLGVRLKGERFVLPREVISTFYAKGILRHR